jgi:hypothetical protein
MEKKLLLLGVVVVVCLCGATAMALAPVGPPTAGLKSQEFSAGFDYAHSEIDFDIEWSSDFASGIEDAKAKNMKSDAYLAKFGYGISDDWEFYCFLGAADMRGKIEWYGETDSFDGGQNFSGGFGTKYTFLKDEQLSWGIVCQMGWSQGDDSYDLDLTGYDTLGIETIDADFKAYDIFLAAGPTYKMGNWRIYGGAGLYYFNAGIDIKYMDTTILEGDADEASFGGYVGAQLDIKPNPSEVSKGCYLFGEFQFTGDAWALGTGIGWKF